MSENMSSITAKHVGPAFALWFFLGAFGAHRFYLSRLGTGAAMAVLSVLGILLTITVIGAVIGTPMLFVVGVWWLIDAFLISKWVAEHNAGRA